jgi:hypothetical protein
MYLSVTVSTNTYYIDPRMLPELIPVGQVVTFEVDGSLTTQPKVLALMASKSLGFLCPDLPPI